MESFTTPPRKLQLLTRLVLLCGNPEARFGWYSLGFGMIFFWIFFMNSNILHVLDTTKWEAGMGKLQKVRSTNADENEQSIYEYIYEYNVDGQTYIGRGYMKGEYEGEKEVPIQYNVKDHRYSKLTEGRREKYATWVGLIIFFPLISLMMVISNILSGIKTTRLLVHGIFTRGKRINNQTTDKASSSPDYTYQFQAKDGSEQLADVSISEGNFNLEKKLIYQDTVRILYPPKQPSKAIVYETILDAPSLTLAGDYRPLPTQKIVSLAPLFFAIVINIVWGFVEIYVL